MNGLLVTKLKPTLSKVLAEDGRPSHAATMWRSLPSVIYLGKGWVCRVLYFDTGQRHGVPSVFLLARGIGLVCRVPDKKTLGK